MHSSVVAADTCRRYFVGRKPLALRIRVVRVGCEGIDCDCWKVSKQVHSRAVSHGEVGDEFDAVGLGRVDKLDRVDVGVDDGEFALLNAVVLLKLVELSDSTNSGGAIDLATGVRLFSARRGNSNGEV